MSKDPSDLLRRRRAELIGMIGADVLKQRAGVSTDKAISQWTVRGFPRSRLFELEEWFAESGAPVSREELRLLAAR